MGYRVAVVGATGNVGREILTTLAEREFPADEVVALASSRSIGREVSFGEDDVLKVQGLDTFDFRGIDIVLSSPGAKVSDAFAPRAAKAGAMVIDNTSRFRMDPDVPLVVPEVNRRRLRKIQGHHRQPELLDDPDGGRAEAAARPRADQARRGLDLPVGVRRRARGDGRTVRPDPRDLRQRPDQAERFTKQIAFNVIPHIDVFMDDGYTKEEWKMAVETRKILDPDIEVTATCVRVPVFIGHSEAIKSSSRSRSPRAGARRAAPGAGRDRRR